jgi:hypothetical protein
LEIKTFWNLDYFEKIVLPLLNLPMNGKVFDVGRSNGGISLLIPRLRLDLILTGSIIRTT